MEGTAQTVCYSLPDNPQIPRTTLASAKHQLHGADDLITLFDLKPLWERSVKPYTVASRSKQKEQATTIKEEGKSSDGVSEANKQHPEAGPSVSGEAGKPLVMEKTYVNYVRDLPGQVRPPKRTVSKYNTALVAASSSAGPMPTLPPEITGRTTMRDIVFRPETTVQRIAPFDEESLRSAFTVEAGPIADIDLSLLESDDVEKQSPHKKKKKRKHQREGTGDKTDEVAAKRSKINAVVRR